MLQTLHKHVLTKSWRSVTPNAFAASSTTSARTSAILSICCQLRRISSTTPVSDSASEKPYYVTTPIFYVNAAPHVGHLYSMVLADVFKRWQELKGRKAILCTGTDEHGMKIQRAAEMARSDPKSFCDKGAQTFKDLAAEAGISNDHFVRTTDPDHKEAVQYAWTLLEERGYIYMDKHEGWYSVSDETFYPSSAVHLTIDPPTGRKIMSSIETGKEVEWTSENNYRFKLSAFKNQLMSFYQRNPVFIRPKPRMEAIMKEVKSGLEDLSISRPRSRLAWGIPVPRDDSQTIYVWLDALINYATKAGYPWAPGSEHAGGWPADLQLIGKDIMRFHCIYWPAFLMALDLPPPKAILTHAHWTLGREKMAKSTGNVVNPFFALNRFGKDVMRFYLVHDGGIVNDADYSNEFIIDRYKKALQGGLGNLASRITRGKGWSVREAVKRFSADTKGGGADFGSLGEHTVLLKRAPGHFHDHMENLDIRSAIPVVMNMIYKTNGVIQAHQPWAYAKARKDKAPILGIDNAESLKDASDAELRKRMERIVFHGTDCLRLAAILLLPVMPTKMNELLDVLGVKPENRTYAMARFCADSEYGTSFVELGRGHVGALFPPMIAEL